MRQMLKAAISFILLGFTLMAVNNCAPNTKAGGVTVFFENMPNLQDNQVYYKGDLVGTVQSFSIGGFRVARLVVTLKDDFLRETGNNLAFFVRYGRLEAIKLSSIGQPLGEKTPLSGFNSSMDLNWFKIKTLIGDRISAAEKRARYLEQRFSADA